MITILLLPALLLGNAEAAADPSPNLTAFAVADGYSALVAEYDAALASWQASLDATEDRGAEDRISRLIFCSGKVYYDLLEFRREHEIKNAAIIRLEQLYPFHGDKIVEIASHYPNAKKWVWCQEEPLNMGGWSFVGPRLQKITDHHVRYAGRDTASSPSSTVMSSAP